MLRFAATGRLTHKWGTAELWVSGLLSGEMAVGDGSRPGKALIYLPSDVAEAADGGVLIGESSGRVRYIAPRNPALLAVAAEAYDAHSDRRQFVMPYRTTRSAAVTWTLRHGAAVIASGVRSAAEGLRQLRIRRSFVPGPHTIELEATEAGRRATTRVSVFLGGELTARWVRRLERYATPEPFDDDDGGGVHYRRAGCRRISDRQVDCRWAAVPIVDYKPQRLNGWWIVRLHLDRTGQITTRIYEPPNRGRPDGFRKRPRYLGPAEPVDLMCLTSRGSCG